MNKIHVKLNRTIPKLFKKKWKFSLKEYPKIRKGWKTWHDGEFNSISAAFDDNDNENFKINEVVKVIHPEDNKYSINFPAEWFDEI